MARAGRGSNSQVTLEEGKELAKEIGEKERTEGKGGGEGRGGEGLPVLW